MADFTPEQASALATGCSTLHDLHRRLHEQTLTLSPRTDLALKVEYRMPGGTTQRGLYFCWKFDERPANEAFQDRSHVKGSGDETMAEWYFTSELR
jgi:hypothetical protein